MTNTPRAGSAGHPDSSGPTSAGGRPQAPDQPVVHSITSASRAHTEEMNARIHRYLISMAIRTACVILVLVVHNPVRWVFAVLAVILPYVAVIMANAVDTRRGSRGPAPVTRIALGQTPTSPPGAETLTVDLGEHLRRSDIRSNASSERPTGGSHERTA